MDRERSTRKHPAVSEKWYFDVLMGGDTYLFFYFAYAHLLTWNETTVNLFCTEIGRAPAITARIPLRRDRDKVRVGSRGMACRYGDIRFLGDRVLIDIAHPQLNISLIYDGMPSWESNHAALGFRARTSPLNLLPRTPAVIWSPMLLKGQVTGSVETPNWRRFLDGPGYIDRLQITRVPLFPVLDELYWGRVHSEHCDITFVHARQPGSRSYRSRAVLRWFNESIVMSGGSLTTYRTRFSELTGLRYPSEYELRYQDGGDELRLLIQNGQPVLESDFVEGMRVRNAALRRFVRTLARAPMSAKFVSSADITGSLRGRSLGVTSLPCISEFVRFGRLS